ncbi:MAG: beta-ketoacyl synthase chain length factor [Candidatus Sumerlaeia bacterium]|nr:beta-ketoacyl synthase chain length factor [Candidatus Sumerlaeia bacterium]
MSPQYSWVISGAAAICSLGTTRQSVIEALRAGKEGFSARPAPEWTRQSDMTAAWATDFKPAPVIPPMKTRRMDRSSQMAIVSADGALKQAGWNPSTEGRDALGLFIGSGFCGTHSALSILQTLYAQGADEVSAAAFPNTVPNAPAGQLAIHFGLEGPSATLLQTGTTADNALLCALGQLESGQCRAALWGGVDELSEYLWFGWKQLGLTGNPAGCAVFGRPQHPQSRGFAAGESAATLIIESADQLKARGGQPLAAIEYAAVGAVEARPWAYPQLAQADAITTFFHKALDACGGPVDLIVGCSNGHPNLDRLEHTVLARLAGERVPVWFPKGQVGEAMGSAALRTVLALWAMEDGFVPGNFWLSGCEAPAGLCVPTQPASQSIRRALITTISAGGTLGAIVISLFNLNIRSVFGDLF